MATSKHSGALAAAAGVLVAVGLLFLMVAVQAQPAEATFPGLPGNTAYTGFDGTDEEIHTINASGGTAFKVTDNNTDDGAPSWGSLP